MDDSQKAKYQKLALEEKERYRRQKEEFDKNGHYTLDDGIKSNQIIPKSSKFIKSVLQPKKVRRSAHFFMSLMLKNIREENPDLEQKQIFKLASE